MSTQKRRVIYMSDEAWAMTKRHAAQHGLSASDWLRALVTTDAFEEQEAKRRPPVASAPKIGPSIRSGPNPPPGPPPPIPPTPFLRRAIEDAMREFNPAPKTGKRK